MTTTKAIPTGYHTVTPYLMVHEAERLFWRLFVIPFAEPALKRSCPSLPASSIVHQYTRASIFGLGRRRFLELDWKY